MNAVLKQLVKEGKDVKVSMKNGQFVLHCQDKLVTNHDFDKACEELYEEFMPPKNWKKLKVLKGETITEVANYTGEEHDGFVLYFKSGKSLFVTADMGQGIGFVVVGIDGAPH